ncbi:MAG: lipopolysaccharide biosynthesis protein [Candidatus Hodarchaeota archaeon]
MVKHSLVYGFGNALNRFLGFLMIPVYTRYLVPSEYGILTLLSLTTEFIGILLAVKISFAMSRFYFEYDSIEDRNQIVSTAFIFFGSLGLVGVILLSFSTDFLAEMILDSKRYSSYFLVSFCTLWFNSVNMIFFYYLRILKKSTMFILVSAFKLILNIIFNIYFLVFLKMGILGILYGNLVAACSMTTLMVLPTLVKLRFRFSKTKLIEMLRFSLPLLPGTLANFAVLVSDRYILKYFSGLADTGIYSLSCRFGVLPHQFLTVPFFQIWGIRRFELLKRSEAEELLGRIITYFFLFLTFVGLGISILAKDTLALIADEKYWTAHLYIPALILAYVIYGLFNHFVMGIMLSKRTKYLSYIDISNGAFNIFLNIIFISQYGIWGACFATLISYTLRIASIYFVSSKLHHIYFEFQRVFKILFCAAILFIICNYLSFGSNVISFVVKFFIWLTFPFLLYLVMFYSKSEISKAKDVLVNRSLKAAQWYVSK